MPAESRLGSRQLNPVGDDRSLVIPAVARPVDELQKAVPFIREIGNHRDRKAALIKTDVLSLPTNCGDPPLRADPETC
jgi:hypothetical protein